MPEAPVLGLDTSTPSTVVALMTGPGEGVRRRHDPEPGGRPRHAEALLVLAEEALAEAGLGWGDVTTIAIGVGPGTFTGLRIGIATARALAQGSGAPLVPVGSLRALAGGVTGHDGPVLAVADARRREVFAAVYRDGEELLEPRALAPAALAELLERSPLPGAVAVGEGAVQQRELLTAAGLDVPPDDAPAHRLDGLALCRLALAGTPSERDGLLPDYRRVPDVDLQGPRA